MIKLLRPFALVLIGLFSNQSVSAQLFYKLKISVDSYSIGNVNKDKITKVFINDLGLGSDLSSFDYMKKIQLRLVDMGYTVVGSKAESNFILSYRVESKPVILEESTTVYQPGTTGKISKTNAEGKTEEYDIQQSGTFVPATRNVEIYKKTLMTELVQTANNRLIWQAESVITDQVEKHFNYSNYLVYAAMREFLITTQAHPKTTFYNRRNLRSISQLFDPYTYR